MKSIKTSLEKSSTAEEQELIVKDALEQALDNQLRNRWAEKLSTDYNVKRQKGRLIKLRKNVIMWTSVAASVLILVMVFIYQPDQSLTQLSHSYAVNIDIDHPGMTKGAGDVDIIPRSTAAESYNQHNYEEALANFKVITNPTSEDQFFMALSHFKLENYNEALSLFQEIEKTNSARFSQEVNWFTALSFLLSDETERGVARLREIKKGDWKYEDAQHLLSKSEK